jgi:PBP1b-binding outer membrane lipoprotein LpoB
MVFLDRAITAAIEKEIRDKARGKITTGGEKTRYGADFFLTGEIDSLDKVTVQGHTTYTRLSFRLTDAGTSAIVWEDDYEVKKHSKTGTFYK